MWEAAALHLEPAVIGDNALAERILSALGTVTQADEFAKPMILLWYDHAL